MLSDLFGVDVKCHLFICLLGYNHVFVLAIVNININLVCLHCDYEMPGNQAQGSF